MADTTEEKVDLRNETVSIVGDVFIVAMSASYVTALRRRRGEMRVSVHMSEDEVCALLAGLQEGLA